MLDLFPVHFDSSAAESTITISVGINLLFPAVPSILRRLCRQLEKDPKKVVVDIAQREGTQSFLCDRDILDVGRPLNCMANACTETHSRHILWLLFYACFVLGGILTIWSGIARNIGPWSIVFFLPAASAVFLSTKKYICLRIWLFFVLLQVRYRMLLRRIAAEGANVAISIRNIQGFVAKSIDKLDGKDTIPKKNEKHHPKSRKPNNRKKRD